MSKFLFLFLIGVMACTAKQPESTLPAKAVANIIFDTDIAGDYDDVGAMALLHAFADKGEIEILATISCNAFETTVPTMSVLNTYFGRPDIATGITKRENPNMSCAQKWAEAIVEKYPHALKSNSEAKEAVSLYREILSHQPDQSVTLVTVGFFTNLADLLNSEPDAFSILNGKELIKKKVKLLISMAASLPEGKQQGNECNVRVDTKASQYVFNEWNTPIILTPLEVGIKIFTGIPLINDSTIENSPVKDAYTVALAADKNKIGRMSWDQTTVLVAARGIEPYFTSRKVNFKINDDGSNNLIPGEKFSLLGFKQTPEEIQKLLEGLMGHQPILNKDL